MADRDVFSEYDQYCDGEDIHDVYLRAMMSFGDEDGRRHILEDHIRLHWNGRAYMSFNHYLAGTGSEQTDFDLVILREEDRDGRVCRFILEDGAEFDAVRGLFAEKLGKQLTKFLEPKYEFSLFAALESFCVRMYPI